MFCTCFEDDWGAAVRRQDKNIIGSCTEAQVQQLCSCRISSPPMRRRRNGAGSLIMLLAARANGVEIVTSQKEKQQVGGYARLLEEEPQAGISGKHDWSILERGLMIPNQDSGTRRLLKLIRRGGQRACV